MLTMQLTVPAVEVRLPWEVAVFCDWYGEGRTAAKLALQANPGDLNGIMCEAFNGPRTGGGKVYAKVVAPRREAALFAEALSGRIVAASNTPGSAWFDLTSKEREHLREAVRNLRKAVRDSLAAHPDPTIFVRD